MKLFLHKKIDFISIVNLIEKALQQHSVISNPTLEDIMEADRWAKEFVMELNK